jgi:hypothetical protein
MKFTGSPFKSDVVEFTWIDLIKLAFGKVLRASALIAKRKGIRHEN